MRRRHLLPTCWLFTDERMGDALWTALARLPRGGGIVFRHYSLPRTERRALFERLRAIARRQKLALLLAGPIRDAIGWRADGVHGKGRHIVPRHLLATSPAHNRREIIAARRAGRDALFLSPVFVTRSHPGARVLGATRFGLFAAHAGMPVIALGGMDNAGLRRLGKAVAGYAAIDAWTKSDQIRT